MLMTVFTPSWVKEKMGTIGSSIIQMKVFMSIYERILLQQK